MLRRVLARWLTVPTTAHLSQDLWGRQDALSHALDALRDRVELVERAETVRAAEHAAALDSLSRLYKRVATRIARENAPEPNAPPPQQESPLELRQRLRR